MRCFTSLLRVLCALLCPLLLLAAPAHAARLALVIGNDSYRHIDPLQNARADAKAMAKALEAAEFRVTLALDQNRADMNAALRRFKVGLSGGDDVVVFYAGHGVELGGVNYLLPVDIRDDGDDQIQDDAVALQRVLGDLAQQKPRFSLVIVDACRDDPFKGRGRNVGTRGLLPTSAANGQMVVYSAGSGQRALDRLGDTDRSPNGVFTRVFVKAIETPGVAVHEVVRQVRSEVVRLAKSVGHEQVPAIYDQAIGDFYFVSGNAPRRPAAGSASTSAGDPDERLWQEAKASDSVEGYEAYLEAYSKGRYVRFAQAAKKKLENAAKQGTADRKAEATPGGGGDGRPARTAGSVFRDCAECPEMVVIPAGRFEMGSNDGGIDERPVHAVDVKGFAIGKYEVTQGQWRAVMGDNPSGFTKCGDDCPAETLNWHDVSQYVQRLNKKISGREEGPYRLPSEAEWEYACRGGERQKYCGSNNADQVAWYRGIATQRVGTKKSNRWGLYDMSGNVSEWTQDCWHRDYGGAPTDGSSWTSGEDCSRRVVRGGTFHDDPDFVLAAARYVLSPVFRLADLGFRLARTLP